MQLFTKLNAVAEQMVKPYRLPLASRMSFAKYCRSLSLSGQARAHKKSFINYK